MQKEEHEIDLGFFSELVEQNNIIYNQTQANTLIVEKPKKGFLRMVILVWVTRKRLILIDFLKIVSNYQNIR